jgi:hypothetical protein
MSDSDDMDAHVAALGATIREEGAAVAAPNEYPLDLSSSSEEEEESPTLPVKKRKTTGRLTVRRKKTTRRVSGARDEQPSPGTANNLLEGRVNDLENEVVTLTGKLVVAEESHKLANKSVTLLKQEIKLLKGENKVLGAGRLPRKSPVSRVRSSPFPALPRRRRVLRMSLL